MNGYVHGQKRVANTSQLLVGMSEHSQGTYNRIAQCTSFYRCLPTVACQSDWSALPNCLVKVNNFVQHIISAVLLNSQLGSSHYSESV